MPVTTNFALPYPGPLDEPCDFAQQWCAFSDAFQVQLDVFQSIIDRTTPAIPVARLLLTEPQSVISGQEIAFDTLSLDTAGWVDFDADPAGITIDRGGYFYFLANAQYSTILSTTATFGIFISSIDDGDVTIDNGVAGTVMGVNTGGLYGTAGPQRFALGATSNVAASFTVNSAAFSIFWHSDRLAP